MTTPSLVAIVGSTEYSLSDAAPRFRLEEDGLGMAPVHRITERGPLQHGDSDIGFRLDPRFIPLVFGVSPSSDASLFDNRAELLRIFKPRNVPVKLRYTLSNGAVRQIDTHFFRDMAFPSRDRKGFYQRVAVTMRASDPLFYDPTLQAVIYGVGAGGSSFAVPMAVPLSVGASTLSASQTITYAGDFLEYPIVIITGPITNPVIANTTTGETLDLTGITISGGDSYTIDCRYGYKTVKNAAGTNKIADLTDDSDLATFHLEADPDAPGGGNTITVTGSSATTATEVYLQYYNRYIGL